MKPKNTAVLGLVASCTMLCSLTGAYGADPLYQWSFNGSDGTNSGTGTGGALTANVGGATTGSFAGAGITGNAGDYSLSASNTNSGGTGTGNAATGNDVNLDGLSQFTVTMWVRQTAGSWGNTSSLINIGATSTPDGSSNPGISLGVSPLWQNGLIVGVNGKAEWTGNLGLSDGNWHFVAFAYNGNNGAYWGQEDMMAQYGGGHHNAAILTGNAVTPATVTERKGIHDGSYWNSAGLPSVGATATAYVANNGSNTSGFTGNLDDVRIYSGLLSVAEIEAIRQSQFADPTPPVQLYWKGDVDDSWTSANWTTDVAGTVPGTLLTDGTQGIAFAATDASNLITLLNADQNVKSIVVKSGTGAVDVGGANSLTIGSNGIYIEETAGSLYLYPSGGIVLDENQVWKNKSPNALIVDSAISGAGTLTKSGLGLLRLGGDNSARTAGTVMELGTLALDHANGLGSASASLVMTAGTLDLNGNSISLGALSGTNVGIIHNTSATECSLTLDVSSDSAYTCLINNGPGGGPVSLIKKGPATVTSLNGSTSGFTGPVLIEDGKFIANHANYGGAPTTSSLGNLQVPGRTITVTYPGELQLTNNNIFGNQNANPALLPELIINQTTMSSTNYNLIGDITLNAASLTQSSTSWQNYHGYQFRGTVRVIKDLVSPGASTISGSVANHLSANTTFDVEDVTDDGTEDLIVTNTLVDPSGDFASTPVGGLTKTGTGTMLIMAATSYTGDTIVNEGVLSIQSASLSDTGKLNVADGAVIDLNFVGSDTVDSLVLGGANQPAGTYGAVGSGAEFETPRITGTGLIIAGEPDPFVDWIASYSSLTGPNTARDADPDGDGLTNIQEFAFNSAPDNGGASGKMRSAVSTVGANQALVLTIPVRDGAVFADGAPASATLPDEQITYQISGTNDLATFDQSVFEVAPALSSGLPALDSGWSYRTFRLDGNVGGATPRGPKGFLRAAIVDDAP